jgi:hypothetical protein
VEWNGAEKLGRTSLEFASFWGQVDDSMDARTGYGLSTWFSGFLGGRHQAAPGDKKVKR